MHFSTSLFLSGFLTLGAAFSEGVSGSRNHHHFHRRHERVDGIAPAEVMPAGVEPAVVEPAHVEPATVDGPPNNAIVDVSTPTLVTPTSTITCVTGVPGIQTIVPTKLATVVGVPYDSTLLTSLSTPLPTSEANVVPTNGATYELSSSYGVAPTSISATGGTVVSSMPLATVTSSVATTELIGVVTSTEGGSVSNCSSTSSLNPPTTINTTSALPSTGVNATATTFSAVTGNSTIHSITSTPATTNTITTNTTNTNTTTTIRPSSKDSVTTTSTSIPTAAWSSSTKTFSKHSTPASLTPSTTYKLTLATPSASAVASQSNGLDMAEFNKTKPCFDKKCEDPGSEMTYNKTVTFNADSGGDGGIRLGRGPDVASTATGGRVGGTLSMAMSAAAVAVGVSIVLGFL